MHDVSVRDSRADRDDRRWLESIYREYLNDLAVATGIFPALGEIGHREPDQLARWFAEPGARVLTVLYGRERVGFAVVRGVPPGADPAPSASGARAAAQVPGARSARDGERSMAEFFIAGPWRRRGIGQQAVRLILDRFTGRWLIREHLRNAAAVGFWRAVVEGYTAGAYQESIVDGDVHQRFESGVHLRRRRPGP